MDRRFEDTLIQALDALEAGDPIEVILLRYPADAASLRPMLITARAAHRLRIEPAPSAQARSRAAFLAQAAEKREEIAALPARRSLLRLPLIQIMTILLIVIGLGGILLVASQDALPESPLYALKRGVETVRLSLAPANNREALRVRFNQERLREVRTLLDNGRDAEVQFSGPIEAISGEIWQIAGIPVQVNKSALIRGIPAVGAIATVSGHTHDGVLTAQSIQIEGNFEIIPDPEKMLPSPTPPIKNPVPTSDVTNMPRITPTPFVPQQPAPTQPSDNGNENENSNDNEENENDNHSGSGDDDNENSNDND